MRHAAPVTSLDERLLGGRPWLAATAAAIVVLAVGLVALGCALVLDDLAVGGRVVSGAIAAWAFGVGVVGLRHALRLRAADPGRP